MRNIIYSKALLQLRGKPSWSLHWNDRASWRHVQPHRQSIGSSAQPYKVALTCWIRIAFWEFNRLVKLVKQKSQSGKNLECCLIHFLHHLLHSQMSKLKARIGWWCQHCKAKHGVYSVYLHWHVGSLSVAPLGKPLFYMRSQCFVSVALTGPLKIISDIHVQV